MNSQQVTELARVLAEAAKRARLLGETDAIEQPMFWEGFLRSHFGVWRKPDEPPLVAR